MRTLVLCNGRPPSHEIFTMCLQWADFFIAADGGGNLARQFGAVPDIVIGDLDSFNPKKGDSFEVIKDPDQETNDLEKALKLALDRKATEVVILAATGQRVDQMLKNLSVLKQFSTKFTDIRIRDDNGDTFLIPDNFSSPAPAGTLVSLFPLSGKVEGIVTSGLKYPLQNEALENGVRDGSSNRVVSSPFKITHKSGDLLLFIAHHQSET